MKHSTHSVERNERHDMAMVAFVLEIADLSARAASVLKLGRQGILNGLIELDDGTGDLQRRILVLMDDVEGSFRTIRRKLGAA